MRYLVKARLRPGKAAALRAAIEDETLGLGSVAGDEYLRNMHHARHMEDGTCRWVEICFCATPLEEELPYWEEYFHILEIKNAHNPDKCRDLNGSEPWACSGCDCTERLEAKMQSWGTPWLRQLLENDEES